MSGFVYFIVISMIGGIALFLWHIGWLPYKVSKQKSNSEKSKRDDIIDMIVKYVTIFGFIIISFTLMIVLRQTKWMIEQTLASNISLIYQLGKQCEWNGNVFGGNHSSYSALKAMDNTVKEEVLKKATSAQIRRIRDLYNIERRRDVTEKEFSICVQGTDCEQREPPDNPSPANAIWHLRNISNWSGRAHAAFILRNVKTERLKETGKEWKDVFEALAYRMKEENEYSLMVSMTALETYRTLCPDYKPSNPSDIFNFNGAINHWEQNSDVCLDERHQ